MNLLAGLPTEDSVFKLARGSDCFTIQANEYVSSPQTGAVSWTFRFHVGENDAMVTRQRQSSGHYRRNVLSKDAEFTPLHFAVLPYLYINVTDGVRWNREAQAFIASGLRKYESVQPGHQTVHAY